MLIIEGPEVDRLLPMGVCIDLMRETFRRFAVGDYGQPARSIVILPGGDLFGFMPAYLGGPAAPAGSEGPGGAAGPAASGYFGAKLVTAFHHNLEAGLPSHQGYVMLFESGHGRLVAMVDAASVTRIRTGAVSAVATQLLARADAHRLALIGAGAQARSHLEAIGLIRNIESVRVFDVDRRRAEAFASEAEGKYLISVRVAASVEAAVADADIVCTLTPSAQPFLSLGMLRPGTHVNAVGAFSPDKREVCSDLVAASRLYADQVEAMRRECGEYLIPLREGRITENHILGALGDLLLGRIQGRRSEADITLFDALGLAVEDVASAMQVFEARRNLDPTLD